MTWPASSVATRNFELQTSVQSGLTPSRSICLDMFVKGLAVTCRSGWFHRACACLKDGHIFWLSSTSAALVTAVSGEKGTLGSMVQQ